MPFSDKTKDEAFRRSGGRCECRRKLHKHLFGRCTSLLSRHGAQFNHVHAQSQGGPDSLSNCEVLCRSCHERTASYGRH
jgi:5-methylcytosine-specific restriction endonuclease McrA